MVFIGRWLPVRPTNLPESFSASRVTSSQEGYWPPLPSSIVISHRPTISSFATGTRDEAVIENSGAIIATRQTAGRAVTVSIEHLLRECVCVADFPLQSYEQEDNSRLSGIRATMPVTAQARPVRSLKEDSPMTTKGKPSRREFIKLTTATTIAAATSTTILAAEERTPVSVSPADKIRLG